MNDNVDPIERLQGYLQTARMQGVKPFYLLIDDDLRLRAARGQARFYGFDGLSPDSDLSDQLLFLVGQDQDPGATLHLPMLELPNGTYCELHAIRLKNGWGLAFCDASIQQQLQARYQQMAHELALAQYQLKHQHQQLQEANEAKSRFIARMSHEFRTPLSSILGFTELAHEDMGDPWRLNADLEAISRGANYLLSLVDNLLDHAVLEQGELIIHPTSCEPYRLIDDLVRIPLKMTADSEERDRLAHRFLTGAGFLLRAVTIGQLGGQFAHRFPAQFEAVRTVQQSVEDGVRQGRLADVVVPVLGG